MTMIKTKATCRHCTKPIPRTIVCGHPEDRLYDAFHICEGCGALVDETLGIVNRDREHVLQGCRDGATCVVCGEYHADRSVLKLSDGKCLHADCFKCSQCGVALDIHNSSVKKRFTSKVQQCIAGTLRCDACSHIPRAVLNIAYCGAASRLQKPRQAKDIYECAMSSLQDFHEKARAEILQTSTYVRAKTSDLSVKTNELLSEESTSKVKESAAIVGERVQAVGTSFWSGLRELHRAAAESFGEVSVGQRLRP